MTETTQLRRPSPAQTTAEDALRFGAVHLDVTDATRSLAFWRDVVGLRLLDDTGPALSLGVEDAELVVLHPEAGRPAARGHTGLYHLALHLPSEAEFARALMRVGAHRWPQAPTDHLTHWATYLTDDDGITVELSFETLDRFARVEVDGGRPTVFDREGRPQAITAPLDVDAVVAHLDGDHDLDEPLAPQTRVGHLHLHVADLEVALGFYADTVGFTQHLVAPAMGFADMSAGGSFPHRLALNTWQGAGATPAPPGTAGLRHFELSVDPSSGLAAGAELHDPSGNAVAVVRRPER